MTKKEAAINLRKSGKTCGEIVNILGAPKSTVWSWIKGVYLSAKIKRKIIEKGKKKSRKNIISYNTKVRPVEAAKIRDEWTNRAKKEIGRISKWDLFLIGTSLFWAEGSKSHRRHLAFANSDANIIKIMMKFFREICDIPDSKIKALVHIYPHLNYKKILNFWMEITNLSKENFYRPQTQISRASRGVRVKNTLPYGTLHLIAGDTIIASKAKGWIQGISEKI